MKREEEKPWVKPMLEEPHLDLSSGMTEKASMLIEFQKENMKLKRKITLIGKLKL